MLATTPVAFTENHGQVGDDEVRFYDEVVWFELRDEDETRGRVSEAGGQDNDVLWNATNCQESRPNNNDQRLRTANNKNIILKQDFINPNHTAPETKELFYRNSNLSGHNNKHNNWYACNAKSSHTRSQINISSVSLLKDSQPTDQVYSFLGPYTIRVEIEAVAYNDLDWIELTLAPEKTNISFQWNNSTGQFLKLNDPNNYIFLERSSYYYEYHWFGKSYTYNYWQIDFNMTFNWTYPDEDFHKIRVNATSIYLSESTVIKPEFYKVENDLIFNGTLFVRGKNSRIIKNNSLVRGGEALDWTGLTVVYEGTYDVYPPEEEYDVTLWDELGNKLIDSPKENMWFNFNSVSPLNTNSQGFNYRINLTSILSECDKTNVAFTIRIDTENITFSKPWPDLNIWHIDSSVEVGITISDHGGGFVDGSNVSYAISKDIDKEWSDWFSVPNINSNFTIQPVTIANFNDGADNFIKWQGYDTVGNGPTESEAYRVLVDTKDVEFYDPWPVFTYVFPSQDVQVGINISDQTSGVDASTIEYSTSINDGMTWSNWTPVLGCENGERVSVSINVSFPVGIENKVRWRACDLAGNGPARSKEYPVSVYAEKIIPVIDLISPLSGAIIRNSTVELTWSLRDLEFQGITYNIVIDSFYPPVTALEKNLKRTNFTLEDLWDGVTFYWKIVPLINGVEHEEYSSDIWWFTVDLSTTIVEKTFKVAITGPDFIILYPGENKSLVLTITNLGNALDNIKLELQKGPITDFLRFDGVSILKLASNESGKRKLLLSIPNYAQSGLYNVTITAYSQNGGIAINDTHQITVAIVEPVIPEPIKVASEEFNWLWLILIIVIIAIILILIFGLIRKKRQKQPPDIIPVNDSKAQTSPQIQTNNKQVPLKPNDLAPPTIKK